MPACRRRSPPSTLPPTSSSRARDPESVAIRQARPAAWWPRLGGASRRRARPLRAFLRWLAAAVIAWFALCVVGLVYLRFFPPIVTTLQLQRWIQYGDPPGSASGFV